MSDKYKKLQARLVVSEKRLTVVENEVGLANKRLIQILGIMNEHQPEDKSIVAGDEIEAGKC